MEQKGIWLLSAILILGFSALTEGGEAPEISTGHKICWNCKLCHIFPPGSAPQPTEVYGPHSIDPTGLWVRTLILSGGNAGSTEVNGRFAVDLKWSQYLCTAQCRCNMDPKTRVNCGPPGITAEQCSNAGCCFSSEVAGVPWCFAPLARQYKQVCPTEVKHRKNCGPPGISADACQAKGCCFESYPPAVPWCFHPIQVEEAC